MLLLFAESGHPIFVQRLHCPGVSCKVKEKEKVSIHLTADQDTVDTIYRIILSVNQLSVNGAVTVICDEYKPPKWNGATCDIGGTIKCFWKS